MIYICEYDHLADDRVLWERSNALLLQLKEGATTGMRWQKQRERILARLLLDYALRNEYGCSLDEAGICHTPFGKPYGSKHPEIYFNISHCSTACACIVAVQESGIDIERKVTFRDSLAKKICHPEEWKILQGFGEVRRQKQLSFLWSLKESFVKWQGQGLAYGVDRINFASHLPFVEEIGQVYAFLMEECNLRFVLQSADAYTMAACGERLQGRIIYMEEKSLLLADKADTIAFKDNS